MEVLCEPPVLVKTQIDLDDAEETLHLTNIDKVFNYYRAIVLVYSGMKLGTDEAALHPPSVKIKRGLEEVLAQYPWAAGRFRLAALRGGGGAVEVAPHQYLVQICLNRADGAGEQGVQFVSACAACALAHLGNLDDPNPAFEPLFASIDTTAPLHSRPLVALQVTTFEDGGVCVSMNWHHALFDGAAASIFLQNIASCARKEGIGTLMDTSPRQLRIKPLNSVDVPLQRGWPSCFAKDLSASNQARMQSLAVTRFSFSQDELAQLRSEALCKQQDCAGSGFKACSRFQALAAHLWKAKAKSLVCTSHNYRTVASTETFPLRMVVNVRGRIVASIPVNYMGNALSTAVACATLQELAEKSLAFAVQRIQEAVKQVTAEHVQWEVDYVEMLGGSARWLPTSMSITSLVGLGFYKADFGWGMPTYFGHPHKQLPYLVVISEGDAHYTCVNAFAAFDSQAELQSFRDALNSNT